MRRRPAAGSGPRPLAGRARSRWSIVALALFAPSLAVVTPGPAQRPLPRVPGPARACAGGAGMRGASRAARRRAVAPMAPLAGVPMRAEDRGPRALGLLLVGVSVDRRGPPPAARRRLAPRRRGPAARTSRRCDGRPAGYALVGIPRSSPPTRCASRSSAAGATPLPTRSRRPAPIVIVCDPLFDEVVGAACGGPAEDALDARGAGLDSSTARRRATRSRYGRRDRAG